MKKKILFLCVSVFVLSALAGVLAGCDGLREPVLPQEDFDLRDEVVRIHIRANSNSEEDQSVKLKVRDAVTEYLTEELKDCRDKSDALEKLSRDGADLDKIAETVLYENGFDYKARVVLTNEVFPERNYEGYTFPEGRYDALLILLGEGVGDNWWCVAFPPLCFVPSGDGENVVYKSWVKEKLEEIFAR